MGKNTITSWGGFSSVLYKGSFFLLRDLVDSWNVEQGKSPGQGTKTDIRNLVEAGVRASQHDLSEMHEQGDLNINGPYLQSHKQVS